MQAELLTEQSKGKEAAALLASRVPSKPEFSQLETRRLVDLATLKARVENKPEEARNILHSTAIQDPELIIRSKLLEGIISYNQRQYQETEKYFRSALQTAVSLGSAYWEAQTLSNLSATNLAQGRYEQAVEVGQKAITTAESVGSFRVAALAHGNIGSAFSYLGEFDSALEHEQNTVQLFEKVGVKPNLMTALNELGLMYDRQGSSQEAIRAFDRAYGIAHDLRRDLQAEKYAANLALTFIRIGQRDQAAEWNQRALDAASSAHDEGEIPYLMRNRAWIAYQRGQLEEAVRMCEDLLRKGSPEPSLRWAVYQLLGNIDTDRKEYAKANQEFEAALKIIDTTRSELLNSHYQLTFLSRLISFYQDYVGALVKQADDAKALQVVESSRARVLSERLGRDFKQMRFPGTSGLQQFAKTSGTSLLEFWLAPDRSYAWLITPAGTRRFDLPSGPEIEKLVDRYRELIEHSIRDPIEANDPLGPKLWTSLMAPIAQYVPKGSRLVVIPDGPLHRLNLETLVVPGPPPHYWIEDVELAVAPSLTLAASRLRAPKHRQPSLLLIGAPDYHGTSYEPLAKAASELSDIQQRFAGFTQAVYKGPEASPAAYRHANPGRFSFIHFTAHAEANEQKPLESAVILSHQDGQYKLHARDIIDMPIDADLVTISACHSAGARTYAGEGLIGFAWAFLQAGAHAVVGGLWDVSDKSTEPLMNEFYGDIAAGRDPAHSLRAAKLALIRKYPRYSRPYYWGPFQVYLGSAAR